MICSVWNFREFKQIGFASPAIALQLQKHFTPYILQ